MKIKKDNWQSQLNIFLNCQLSIVHLFWASCRIRTNDPEITNHVLWPTELKRQVGKLTTSRRYNQVPLLRSSPGGFRGSMPCRTYPGAKVDIIFYNASVFMHYRWYLFLSGCKPFILVVVKKCLFFVAGLICLTGKLYIESTSIIDEAESNQLKTLTQYR